MSSEFLKRRLCAALALGCMLVAATPAAAQAQQSPAPAQAGYLGVELHSLSRQEAQARGAPGAGGAEITKVEANSPAAAAGLKRGDILLEIDGKSVTSAAQFLKIAASRVPGTVVRLRVQREGRLRAGPVKLGALPGSVPIVKAGLDAPATASSPAANTVALPAAQTQDALMVAPASEIEPATNLPASVVTQLGHTGIVLSVAFSPDSRLALSGSGDKTLILWELSSGRELRSFSGHAGVVNSVAFSPNGTLALSGSGDKTLKLWEVASGRDLRTFSGHTDAILSVAYSPDGRLALSGSRDKTLKLWEVASGRELRTFSGHEKAVNSIAFSPDGTLALSGSADNTLKLWEVASGRELRTFSGHEKAVNSIAFSPDGTLALSGSGDKTLKLWELASGRELRSFSGHTEAVTSIAFYTGGAIALSGSDDKTLKLWELASGRELRSFLGHTGKVLSVAVSADGRLTLSGSHKTLKLWEVASGRELRSFSGHADAVSSVAFSPNGRLALSGSGDKTMKLWELASGRELRSFSGHADVVNSVAFSPDGTLALSGSGDKTLKLWDLLSGGELRSFEGHTDLVFSVAFSPDGTLALSGSADKTMKLWEVASGRELHSFAGHTEAVSSVAFSPDGTLALSGSDDNTLKLWEVASGRELRSFSGHTFLVTSVAFSPDGTLALSGSWDNTVKLWNLASGRELRNFSGRVYMVNSVALSPDGTLAMAGGADTTVKLWELAKGRELRSVSGHKGWVSSVAISPNGRQALSGGLDGTVRLQSVGPRDTGGETELGPDLATMFAGPGSEWVTFTPQGFFASWRRDTDMLAISRGLEVTTIGQVHQSLFNPDLVREALAGDPDGVVRRAAGVIDLEKVLDAGPPPAVAITSHQSGSRSSTDLVTVAARVTDRGKGIGRIEWRVNGVTVGVMSAPTGPGPDYAVTQELALDPRENQIEVIAYEGRNLLASRPAQTTIVYDGPADAAKPKLHILAIGINAYEDKGWKAPGEKEASRFPPLGLAVGDAKAFAAEMEKASAGLYGEVVVRTALDKEATPANLDRIVREMAAEINPRDTFVLFAAAHGYSLNGSYYMIPQDYQGGADPKALKARAIGQDRLQDWIANRIKAKKALILLDTCESGALTGGYTRSRADVPASEAAVGRLHEATGRPVLTAAAEGKPAFEGYKGHGVFTYALIEAFHKGDTNNNGKIELTELASFVQRRVPELVTELGEHGGVVKGVAVVAMRGRYGDRQSAQFGATGEDFAIAARLP